MNLQQLRYIVEIEKTQSITWAADNLYMGQPSLSRNIRELEEELGFDLFARTSKGMIPTERGKEVLYHVHKILDHLAAVEEISANAAGGLRVFRISIPPDAHLSRICTHFLASIDEGPYLADFQKTGPTQALDNLMDQGHSLALLRLPKTGEPGLVARARENGLFHQTLAEWTGQVLLSAGSPLAAKELLREEDLDGCIELAHTAADKLLKPARTAGEPPRPPGKKVFLYSREEQYDFLRHVPQAYLWTVPLTDEQLDRQGLVMRPCESEREDRTILDILVHHGPDRLTPLDELFVDTLNDHYARWRDEAANRS